VLPIKTILHPTDFSESSHNAFRLACSVARDHDSRLIVLHVISMPDLAYKGYGVPGSPLLPDEYMSKVRQELEKIQQPDPQPALERRLEEGEPASEIIRVATDTGANLIVMGTHGQTGLRHILMGSVAEQVVRKAPCAVLTLKTPPAPTAQANS
jgi:nucleotide-binding universal stress UspA family protein